MRIGDVVCMRTVKPRIENAQGKLLQEITYTAPRGQTFVLLLLGTTERGTERDYDPDGRLRFLGWMPIPDPGEPCVCGHARGEHEAHETRDEECQYDGCECCAFVSAAMIEAADRAAEPEVTRG